METSLDGKALTEWLNSAPTLPGEILYGQMESEAPCMSLEPGREEKVLSRDIAGGRRARRGYSLTYRLRPELSQEERLSADRLLDSIGRWAEENPPALPQGPEIEEVRQTGMAAAVKRLAGGQEDHRIDLEIVYAIKPRGDGAEKQK